MLLSTSVPEAVQSNHLYLQTNHGRTHACTAGACVRTDLWPGGAEAHSVSMSELSSQEEVLAAVPDAISWLWPHNICEYPS